MYGHYLKTYGDTQWTALRKYSYTDIVQVLHLLRVCVQIVQMYGAYTHMDWWYAEIRNPHEFKGTITWLLYIFFIYSTYYHRTLNSCSNIKLALHQLCGSPDWHNICVRFPSANLKVQNFNRCTLKALFLKFNQRNRPCNIKVVCSCLIHQMYFHTKWFH